MADTLKIKFRVTGVTALPAIPAIPGQTGARGVTVSAVQVPESGMATNDATVFSWPFQDPAAAAFFNVHEDVELTFSKPDA